MTISLLESAYLWLLVLVPLLWFVPRRVQDVRHGLVRTALFVALITGLSRPVLIGDQESPRHVVILDRTASVSATRIVEAKDRLEQVLAAIPDDHTAIVIDMHSASDALEDRPDGVQEWLLLNDQDHSSLSGALELALASIPAGAPGSVTLISDCLSTDRRWGRAVRDLIERKIPLNTIEIDYDQIDVRPVGLVFEESIRVGHTAQVQVRVIGQAESIRLRLESGGKILIERKGLALQGQLDTVLRFEPPASGFHDVQLSVDVFKGEDAHPSNNTLTQRIAVQSPLRLLYLGHRMQGGRDKLEQLLGGGYEVFEPTGDDGTQILESVDVIMLDDRPVQELSAEWRQGIEDAVMNHGVGLFASGGRAAFGSGGYHDTEIEKMLPVEFIQKEEKKDPSTTLAIIIDTSGSMVGNRMTLAKQVARLAMRRLQPHDKVGIVEFYGTKTWAAPIQSAANQIDLQRALNRLAAQGGTVLMPAIEEAYYAMKNVQTRYKHVLILTDAGVETGPYETVCRRMSDEGMTLSTVLVGPGRHSEFLVDLADWGGGRYYNATDRFNLPELLLKKPSTSVLPAYRPERVAVEATGGPGWWGDLDPTEIPPLDGYVEAELRPGSEQLLATAKGGTPVMASRLHGLGRVTAFLSEPMGAGTRGWSEWNGLGGMLGRVLARTARGHQPPFDYSLSRRGDLITLEARRVVREDLVPVCDLVDADGNKLEDISLREVAPGVFRHTRVWPHDTAFHAQAQIRSERLATTLLVSGAQSDVVDETQVDPALAFPGRTAAERTGGEFYDVRPEGFDARASTGEDPVSLTLIWPWLVLLALGLFILDVFHRRRAQPHREIA